MQCILGLDFRTGPWFIICKYGECTAGTTESNLRHRIDIQATKGVYLEFDGIPFVIFVIVNRTKAPGH